MDADRTSEFAIVAPVSRFLAATDLARTTTFYRDILGFEVRPSDGPDALEVCYGPARIQFGLHEDGPEGREEPQPGSAVVFFETDRIEELHASVRARGGTPTALERVNGIKMRVFEIRDPNGHTLWFGQSFTEPDKPRPTGMVEKLMPEFPLSDVSAGVDYYCNRMGFSVNYAQSDLAVMDRDDVRLLLVAKTERHKGMGSAYADVHDADALHDELRKRGASVQGVPAANPGGSGNFVSWISRAIKDVWRTVRA